jgi:FtsP/CotA-like multicopper oxidase with cupredoxin domain
MLTRRQMLQASMVGAAGYFASLKRPVLQARQSLWTSPPTRAFYTPLPVPPTLDGRRRPGETAPNGKGPFEVEAFADVHESCEEFVDPDHPENVRYFEVVAEERMVTLHPDLGATAIWGYRPANVTFWPYMLGPTFKAHIGHGFGHGFVVRFKNQLPTAPRPFGVPMLTTHLHGGHHPARFDGFPFNIDGHDPFVFGPGHHYDYCFPLLDVGSAHGKIDTTERPATLWYHDHFLDFTGPNVYHGLAGFFLVFDEIDCDDETNAQGLQLPSGRFDVPLVLQDRVFAGDGSLIYDPLDHDGFLGDKMLVNGAVQPYLNVERRKYRFRFLNGSNARIYQIAIADSDFVPRPFDQIATEGGLLSHPIRGIDRFMLSMAERVEIVFDFSAFPDGTELFIVNRAVQNDGRGPDEFVRRGTRLLKFRVVGGQVSDPSRVPDDLRPFAPIPPERIAIAKRRRFELQRRHGGWMINDEFAGHLDTPVARPRLDQPEIWKLVNDSGGWWHPVHIHLEFCRVLTRNGRVPPLDERDGMAKKDTLRLGPEESVEVYFEFRDFAGPWTFHCHNMEHEDRAMMARFDTVE